MSQIASDRRELQHLLDGKEGASSRSLHALVRQAKLHDWASLKIFSRTMCGIPINPFQAHLTARQAAIPVMPLPDVWEYSFVRKFP